MNLDYLKSVRDFDLVVDHLLIVLAESGLQIDFDKEWMGYVYRADRREEYQNETYYKHHIPLEVTPCIADPKSTERIVQAIDNNALARLKSATNYVDHHCPKLRKTLGLVLKNGATRRFASYMAELKSLLEKELLQRSKRSLIPRRSKPRLTWRGTATTARGTRP